MGVYMCHGQAGNQVRISLFVAMAAHKFVNHGGWGLQEFGFSDLGEIQFEEDLCLDVSSSHEGSQIMILNCHGLGGNQKWSYDNQVGT